MRNLLGTWSKVRPADGPGFHSDEASSAWPVIKNLVTPATARAIANIDHIARANPDDGDDDGDDEETPSGAGMGVGGEGKKDDTIGFSVLIPLARMVTGQWGVEPSSKRLEQAQESLRQSIVRASGTRASLPIYRENPYEVGLSAWLDTPFWSRMKDLSERLEAHERQARTIYVRKGVTDESKQGWVNALAQCRADVEWVRSQEGAARRGEARVVERDAAGNVRSVMGIDPSKDWRNYDRLAVRRTRALSKSALGRLTRSNPRGKKKLETKAKWAFTRKPWGILAAKGNQKLPFVAYSTLPMASCPGAGSCAVGLTDDGAKKGYCYSFTAWRYPDSFARQFRNCLAEFADREFAIIAGGAGDSLPTDGERRINAALSPAGRAARSWHRFCGDMAEAYLDKYINDRNPAKRRPAFMRLYVDGDINSADNVYEWMTVCAELQRTRTDSHPGVQVYGYSKTWDQFLALDRRSVQWPSFVRATVGLPRYGGGKFAWPNNYVLNLSADSVWNDENNGNFGKLNRSITVAMSALPISRGYFKSIELKRSIKDLNAQFDPRTNTLREFSVPPADETPFPFSAERIRAVADMNRTIFLAAEVKGTVDARRAALEAAYIGLVRKYDLEGFVKKEAIVSKGVETGTRFKFDRPSAVDLAPSDRRYGKRADDYAAEFSQWLLKQLYTGWFSYLYAHGMAGNEAVTTKYGRFADIAVGELALDEWDMKGEKPSSEDFFDAKLRKKMHDATTAALKKARASKGAAGTLAAAEEAAVRASVKADPRFQPDAFRAAFGRSKAFQTKAIAVAIHEVLWSFGLGGSCPLVCGNCYDTPTPPKPGTPEYLNARHRCASDAAFRGRTVFIGRH
jgi:hypothetical protein